MSRELDRNPMVEADISLKLIAFARAVYQEKDPVKTALYEEFLNRTCETADTYLLEVGREEVDDLSPEQKKELVARLETMAKGVRI